MDEKLLIGIGAQKAGTTWLAEYLRDHHSSVHFPHVKEVHFFDNYCMPNYGSFFEEQRLSWFQRDISKLSLSSVRDQLEIDRLTAQLARFKGIISPENYIEFLNIGRNDEPVLCDITPDYALLDASGFKLMKSVHPDVKLVFLLRNPADRFWSSLRFNHTHNADFDIEAEFDVMLVRQDFVRFANYDRTIRAVLQHFEPDELYIEFYEHLFSDNAIEEFCNWLGVSFVKGNYAKKSNAAVLGDMPSTRRQQAVVAYQQTYKEISARFGGHLPECWLRDIADYL